MENCLLEEYQEEEYKEKNIFLKEEYQTECGKMLYTSKGRLIFLCVLCESEFQEFDFFEVHIRDHIPLLNEYEMDEMDSYEPTQHTDEDEFEEIIEGDDHSQLTTDTLEKEENSVMKGALQKDEMTLPEKKQQNRFDFKSGSRIQFISGREILEKYVTHASYRPRHKANELIEDQNITRDVENEKRKHKNTALQIPSVVREVKSWTTARYLQTPEEERKHKCPVCEAGFKDKHVMLRHFKRHSDNKDHKCPECEKRFYTASEVRLHMRSHRKERPFLCNVCGRAYNAKFDLLEHLKRHSNQRNHKCEICEKSFFSKAQLMGHMAGHSSERPFACHVCTSRFTRRKALTNHMKLHENKLEYQCELCDAKFNQRAGLFSHTKTVHKTD